MYTSVVSLGAWCQVAEQFRRHNFPRTHSPFEWTVSTWSCLMAIIADDGKQLATELTVDHARKEVVCQAYGLLHPHDFHKKFDKDGNLLPPDAEEITEIRKKYTHKMDDFRRACQTRGGRIAFVRMGGEAEPAVAWPYLHDQAPLTSERVNSLADLLVEYCGHSDFDLFVMLHDGWHPFEDTAPLHSNAKVVRLPHPAPPVDWYGHESDWEKVYAAAGITLTARAI